MRARKEFRCFEGEIRQVLSNLISNALDAMPETGRLLLRSRLGCDWKTGSKGVVMTVADTGVGMSRETRDKLFHAFFTTKGLTGTGLGLWVTKEIVARHHGSLRLRSSQSPSHHGTVFSLFLPFEAVVR
jgi:signal transduction histidine kinase